jgi:hypothetical protein
MHLEPVRDRSAMVWSDRQRGRALSSEIGKYMHRGDGVKTRRTRKGDSQVYKGHDLEWGLTAKLEGLKAAGSYFGLLRILGA